MTLSSASPTNLTPARGLHRLPAGVSISTEDIVRYFRCFLAALVLALPLVAAGCGYGDKNKNSSLDKPRD